MSAETTTFLTNTVSPWLQRAKNTFLHISNLRITTILITALSLIACLQQVVDGSKAISLICLISAIALINKEVSANQKRRELLDSVMDAATEIAVIATDLDGRITLFNKGANEMFGYSSDEMVGLQTLEALHEPTELAELIKNSDASTGIDALLAPVRDSDGKAYTQDWTYIRKDGGRLTVSLAITALRHRAGKIIGFLGVAADVTSEREQEKEQQRLLFLEKELTQKLVVQNHELVRMDRSKDEFVATVSHEFRTPLTSIKGYLETLLDEEAGNLTGMQRKFLETIERNSVRLGRLVEDLLFAARVDAGGASVAVLAEVDLVELINEVVESARPHASAKSVVLRCELDDQVTVAADPARMSQLLDNLTSNAIKFTPEGGSVIISAKNSHNDAIISVQDTGIGIPQDEQSRLFRRFFRSRLATEQAIAGTGIGLAIVKEIADAHGATIGVESIEGVGTTFHLTMPLLAPMSSR